LRFRSSERLLHWSVALPFLVCAASAAVLLFVYNPHPERPYRLVFAWIHRIAAIGLLTLPPLAVLLHLRDAKVYLKNLKEGLLWSLDDVRWLMMKPLQVLRPAIALPEEGKFNAGEKLNFAMTTLGYPVFVASGLLIWNTGVVVVPWYVHIILAAMALPLVGGHIFMATLNPSTRAGLPGMFTGLVDRGWASHHYRRWYRECFGGSDAPHGKGPAPRGGWSRTPAAVALCVTATAIVAGVGSFVAARSYFGGPHVESASEAPIMAALPAASAPAPECKRAPGEKTPQPCFARGQAALDACLLACGASPNERCNSICTRQAAACNEGCVGEPAPRAGADTATADRRPPAEVDRPDGGARGKPRLARSGRGKKSSR
jgi:formate dehydrogenase subunit gamma